MLNKTFVILDIHNLVLVVKMVMNLYIMAVFGDNLFGAFTV